ncbi:MAG: glycoside hydrolase family 52 protein [Planctomycetota bacterium]|jgi:hypothetical protein
MTIFYNAFHSPIGAHSSFTLGCLGRNGGLGLELGHPADENMYIGVESRSGGQFQALPFFEGAESESARYDHSAEGGTPDKSLLSTFPLKSIKRDYNLGTDTWSAGDMTFTIYSPVCEAPDPAKAKAAALKHAYIPSVLAEITIDNSKGKKVRKAFFGYMPGNSSDANRREGCGKGSAGIGKGQGTAIYTDAKGAAAATAFNADEILTQEVVENHQFGLGPTTMLILPVPAGRKVTFRFAICFYRGGIATTGMDTSYLYTRYFKNIAEVGRYSLDNFASLKRRAVASNKLVASKKLNHDQRFQMIHAIRSYYGSTQLLEHKGKPVWVVNEGEYRMMNTFDLTVDQLFFEMKMNPWTVCNELDLFTRRYSYTDKVHLPGGENTHPGGLSFTHDMGQQNHFSRPGYSAYELFDLDGCFSHMTHEQLVNWVLCAAVYAKGSGDQRWLKANLSIFRRCLTSMMNRDHPKDSERNGLMALDSSRTMNGAEITTYDSLDESLGQSRNNVYMAVKCWAAYLAMEEIFTQNKMKSQALKAKRQAERAASTIPTFLTRGGYIPAVMGEKCNAKIIPAVEGLAFPHVLGLKKALKESGPYGGLIRALKTHLTTILKKGTCLYGDGGWKLSSSADNSWLSKIYLSQFVTREVLGLKTATTGKTADAAHAKWLLKQENLRFAWSDQMRSGVALGSKYYPRGVTSILWLSEK